MAKYLVNLTKTHFSADDNRIFVERGRYVPITDAEAEHADIVFSIRRGWVEVTDTEPTAEPEAKEEVKITEPFKEQAIDPSDLPGNKADTEATVKPKKGK